MIAVYTIVMCRSSEIPKQLIASLLCGTDMAAHFS